MPCHAGFRINLKFHVCSASVDDARVMAASSSGRQPDASSSSSFLRM
jgi:hypothetical protein